MATNLRSVSTFLEWIRFNRLDRRTGYPHGTGQSQVAASDDGEILIAERIQGNFSRRLILGESLDGDRVSSVYSDGVLTIVIPVIEQAKPKAETSQSGRVAEPVGAAAVTK